MKNKFPWQSRLDFHLFMTIGVLFIITLIITPIMILSEHTQNFIDPQINNNSNKKKTDGDIGEEFIITLPLISHQEVQRRRRHRNRRIAINEQYHIRRHRSTQQLPPSSSLGQGYGTHYVDIYVGRPNPQRQTLIVDTGSDITAFPCDSCSNCGQGYHIDEPFRDESSNTFNDVSCDIDNHIPSSSDGADNTSLSSSCMLGVCKKTSLLSFLRSDARDEPSYCQLSVSYAEGSSWNAFEASDWVFFGTSPNYGNRTNNKKESKNEQKNHFQHKSRFLRDNFKHASDTHDHTAQDTETLNDNFMNEVAVAKEQNTISQQQQQQEEESKSVSTPQDFSFRLHFGCQYKLNGLFKTQIEDGIMGMENSDRSAWKQMYKAGMIQKQRFAMCIGEEEKNDNDGDYYDNHNFDPTSNSHAGILTLGGIDERLNLSPMVYAQNTKDHGWYTVYINAMYLKFDNKLNSTDFHGESTKENQSQANFTKLEIDASKLNENRIIIDSGTTDSYLPFYLKVPFQKAFKQIMGKPYEDEWTSELNYVDLDREYPTIVFQLKAAELKPLEKANNTKGGNIVGLAGSLDASSPYDVLVDMKPSSYIHISKKGNYQQPRIHWTYDNIGVLGANFMFQHNILFDIDNQRIGFANSECDYKKL